MKIAKYLKINIIFSTLLAAFSAQAVTLLEWQNQTEVKLQSTSEMTKIVMIPKADAFLLKIYYQDGSKSLFKPNTQASKSMRVGMAVYKLAKALNSSIKIFYTPMVKFSLGVDEVLRLAADDPKTSLDEAAMLREAIQTRPVIYDGQQLIGSNALWAEGLSLYGTLFRNTSRDGLLSLASRLGTSSGPGSAWDDQVSNLFIMDYITANNDRGGNFHFDLTNKRIWAIDNDDAFVAADAKKFVANVISNMQHVDRNFLTSLDAFFSSVTDAQLQEEIFSEYSAAEGLKYARQTRARFEKIKARYRN